MEEKEKLLKEVTDYYLSSREFNGCDPWRLDSFTPELLKELLKEGSVQILSEIDDINIYINRLNRFKTSEEQLAMVDKGCRYVIYPTPEHLATLGIQEERPFTKMLASGMEQMHCIYFAVDVLENYVNDPRYLFQDCGYMGVVSSQLSENEEDDLHEEYIQQFGIAYPKNPPHDSDRAICVFLRDLARLNYKAQCKWMGFMLSNQAEFVVNGTFLDTALNARWDIPNWIFDCVLEEVKFINVLVENIGLPSLFSREYSRQDQEIIGYRILLLPTYKNYYDFILALEKMIVNNINYDTFQKEIKGIKAVDRKNERGEAKGSIIMLREWFQMNYHTNHEEFQKKFEEIVIKPLQAIRKIRQTPAHKIYSNQYDNTLYQQQNQIITSLYESLYTIRMILLRHPKNRGIAVPEMIKTRENIVLY